MKLIKYFFPLLLLLGIYFLGPRPDKPKWSTSFPVVPDKPEELEKYIQDIESRHKIKWNNEAQIVWYDSNKAKTPFSIVYLHGFSASQMEGDPVHRNFAKSFGCNLFLARLSDHGVDTVDQLLHFTVDRFWESSKQALAIGEQLGEKVILVSTSTGGTMALALAAEFPDKVYALINMSPNIELNNSNAYLLNNPWGLQIARSIIGGDNQIVEYDSMRKFYWNEKYRIESLTQLQEMLEDKMTPATFRKVSQPVLNLYYYKNDTEQDPTVRVSAILTMHNALGTPESLKVEKAIPNSGEHVIGSSLVSKDLESVQREMDNFAIDKLKILKVNSSSSAQQ